MLRDADLADATLVDAQGLFAGQLAGAILTGARLPKDIADGFLPALNTIAEACKNARTLLFGLLVGCVYSWLTIATTTDFRLLTNTSSSPLPVIQTAVPIAGFYWAAPVLLLGVFLFLHLGLQHLWELVSTLPAVFPDGVPEDRKAYPWLLTGLIRSHVPRLRHDLPAFARLRTSLAVALCWWIVPVTMLLFWVRYLPRHHWAGTSLHAALVMVAVMSAIRLQTMARKTLRGEPSQRFSWRTAGRDIRSYRRAVAVLVTAAIMVSVSLGVIKGTPKDWIPRAFRALGYNVFADLHEATAVSIASLRDYLRYADLTDADLTDAPLTNADLTGATLTGATLTRADLTAADLTRATLTGADLRNATLTDAALTAATLTAADLTGATLTRAGLTDADLRFADLTDADLTGATLTGADLRNADLTDAGLQDAFLSFADLTDATLTGADFMGADLSDATLTNADLTTADLTRANLTDADLSDATNLLFAKFTDATLTDADLSGAYLFGATLIRATLTRATLTRATLTRAGLTDADLRFADLTDADLTNATVTQNQLDLACGDTATRLPEGLTIRPCPEDSAPPQP